MLRYTERYSYVKTLDSTTNKKYSHKKVHLTFSQVNCLYLEKVDFEKVL
jgi:hypothetical protein